MSLTEKYRQSQDYREILRILQRSSTLTDNFVWQSHALGRTIVPIHHFEIDFVSREVVIFFEGDSRIERELPLYVKLDYRTSVFKIEEFREGMNSLSFPFPKDLRTLELRAFPRYTFPPEVIQTAMLRPSLTGGRDSGSDLQVRVMDVSHYGLGLIVSENNRSFLKNNRILWVTHLGEQPLSHPVLAEVAYMNNELDPKFTGRRQKDLKVGLRLSGIIPETIFREFLKVVH